MKEKKVESQKTGEVSHDVLKNWLAFAEEASRAKHWEWFVIDQFIKGNHDIKGSPEDNVIRVTKKNSSINYPINKVYAVSRAVKGFVTRHKPKIEVDPVDQSEGARNYARRAQKLLERDNRLNNSRKINKEWAGLGVDYGVGYRQIGYDKENKVSIRWTIEPFDLLLGARSGQFEDVPFIIKPIVRTVGYWRKKFPEADVSPDNKLAFDRYKELAMQIELRNSNNNPQRPEEQTMVGYECWYRTDKPNKLGGTVNRCMFTDNQILSKEETPFTEYPFIPYYAQVKANHLYPDGHIKHILSPQRMLNLLNEQLLEYNHIVNRGRWQVPKGSGFDVVMAKEGQIVRYNPGKPVNALTPPSINPLIQWQINYADQAIQVIGSQNDASQGRQPYAGASGDLVEALQAGDSNNISDLRDNFEDALALEAQMILKMYALFEDEGFDMLANYGPDDSEKIRVVGENYAKGPKVYSEENGAYLDYLSVTADNQVKVSVTSEFGETKAARFALLKELVSLGMPLKFMFQFLEFPNSDDIMQRIADENLAEAMKQQMMEEQAQQAQMQQPSPEGLGAEMPIEDMPVPMPE